MLEIWNCQLNTILHETNIKVIVLRNSYLYKIALGIFWGRVSQYAATPFIVAVCLGHSDITMFCPWSPIATINYMDRAKRKNSKSCSDDWHR
jgi:hypothetical protein